ncbi:MAG: cyclic nucleotide-binding domain-containing protein [Kofleriaceae bacterium]
MARKDVNTLRDEAAKAIERGKLPQALAAYEELETREPMNPAWPKRLGETHRRSGKSLEAVAAFERAIDKYVTTGFLVQAIAVCKVILQIDPDHSTTVIRLAELAGPSKRKAATTPLPAHKPASSPPPPPVPDPNTAIPIVVSSSGPIPVIEATPTARSSRQSAAQTTGPTGPDAQRTAPLPLEPPQPPVVRFTADSPEVDLEDAITTPLPRVRDAAPPPPPPRPNTVITERLEPITLSPGAPLDSLDLVSIIPGSTPLTEANGKPSGISVIPLEPGYDDQHLDLAVEVEVALEVEKQNAKIAAMDPGARRALIKTPLFAGLPGRILERLIKQMSLLELSEGQVLFAEGDDGDCLYVISEGEVSVTTGGQQLAKLGPSAFFGEIALVTDQPRSATIRATMRTEVLAIDRNVIREAAADQPEIVTLLFKFVRDRLVNRVTHTSELFKPFTEEEREALSAKFELVEVVAGATLIVEQQRADGLYVVVAGKAEVWRNGDNAPIASLSNGDVFGEQSLMSGRGSTASVRAATQLLALRMPAHTFHESIMTHPQMLAYLGELAARRSPRPRAIEEFVDFHVDTL